VGISGYGWIDSDYKKTRIGDLANTTKFPVGGFLCGSRPPQ
jgi:hypothetical protein